MTEPDDDLLSGTYYDVRFACPNCGRFLREDQITGVDNYDPSAYYGVSSTITVNCGRCGEVDNYSLVIVAERPLP